MSSSYLRYALRGSTGTLLCFAAVAAQAQTPAHPAYYGGGANLPVAGYVGSQVATSNNPATSPAYSTTGGDVSAFGFFVKQLASDPSSSLSYCRSGSDFGKYVFGGGSDASQYCAPFGVINQVAPSNFGFSAVGQAFADYVASDVSLAADEYANYVSRAGQSGSNIYGRGQPVQVPAVVTSIGILYNNADVTGQLNLSSVQLCEIFDGTVTNWNQIDSSLPSKPLRIIYRNEANPATFALANHLNAFCADFGHSYAVDAKFSKVLPSPLPAGASTEKFVPALGNALATAFVEWSDGALGYVETANSVASVNESIKFALINGLDPIVNLPEAANTISASALVADKALGAYVPNGRPSLQSLTPPAPGCVQLVDPLAYAYPIDGYPIISVSYLLLSSAGNGTKAADLRKLGSFLVQNASYPASGVSTPRINTINVASPQPGTGSKGIASLPLNGSVAATVTATAQNCISN
jgi:phosphate transport system substrate-binding protein